MVTVIIINALIATLIATVIAVVAIGAMNKTSNVIVELTSAGATMPYKAHSKDASYDICVDRDVYIKPGLQTLPTGVKIALPPTLHAFVMPTSGNSSKGMNARKMLNGKATNYRLGGHIKVGTIDNGYRGEIGVTFDCYEQTGGEIFIARGTKVAQLWIAREENVCMVEGIVYNDTERGGKGFGSTDIKA